MRDMGHVVKALVPRGPLCLILAGVGMYHCRWGEAVARKCNGKLQRRCKMIRGKLGQYPIGGGHILAHGLRRGESHLSKRWQMWNTQMNKCNLHWPKSTKVQYFTGKQRWGYQARVRATKGSKGVYRLVERDAGSVESVEGQGGWTESLLLIGRDTSWQRLFVDFWARISCLYDDPGPSSHIRKGAVLEVPEF